ncbi:MAG: hypothetical protein KC464_13630, partial [Myxococcales bacterium]|nr:hypothetical protein [Myxococcales bacterium]
PPAPGKTAPTAGTPKAKGGKGGGQRPDEAENVPKTGAAGKNWLEGMQALSRLAEAAQRDPETDAEIHTHLDALRRKFGFTKLDPRAEGDHWSIWAELNPKGKGPDVRKDPGARKKAPWPPAPKPPTGPKPAIGAPNAAEWRYQEYLCARYAEKKKPEEVLSFAEYKARYYDVVEGGGRPGRKGGVAQRQTREKLADEENFTDTETRKLGPYFVDMYKKNARGGVDYVEVDDMLVKGIPRAGMRTKLKDELGYLKTKDRLVFIDKVDRSKRITYRHGDAPGVVDRRTHMGTMLEE